MMLRLILGVLCARLAAGQVTASCSSYTKKKQCKGDLACDFIKLKRGQCSGTTCHPQTHNKKKGKYCVDFSCSTKISAKKCTKDTRCMWVAGVCNFRPQPTTCGEITDKRECKGKTAWGCEWGRTTNICESPPSAATNSPSLSPSSMPSLDPTPMPSLPPTIPPSMSPTPAPTPMPSVPPTLPPTMSPTPAPVRAPPTCLNARIVSAGCDDDPNGCGFVEFYVDGNMTTHSGSRGMNIMVINQYTQQVEDSRAFDTYGDQQAATDMVTYINSIVAGRIVLFAAHDSAETYMDAAAWDAVEDLGASLDLQNVYGHRESYALIGAKGMGVGNGQELRKPQFTGLADLTGAMPCDHPADEPTMPPSPMPTPFPSFQPTACILTRIVSAGCDADPNGCGFAEFYVNGNQVQANVGRGMNLVVINQYTQQVEDSRTFDTYGNAQATTDMMAFVNTIVQGRIVLFAAADSAEIHMTAAAWDVVEDLGASVNDGPNGLVLYRDSYALIGAKGLGVGNGQEMHVPREDANGNFNGYADLTGSAACQPMADMPTNMPSPAPTTPYPTMLPSLDPTPSPTLCGDAKVVSAGCDADPNGCGFAEFYVNGAQLTATVGRGMNIVVINQYTQQVEDSRAFDTYGNSQADDDMINFVNTIVPGRIVLFAAADSAEIHMTAAAWDVVEDLGASVNDGPNGLVLYRDSYALIGAKGLGAGNGMEMHVPREDANGNFQGSATVTGTMICEDIANMPTPMPTPMPSVPPTLSPTPLPTFGPCLDAEIVSAGCDADPNGCGYVDFKVGGVTVAHNPGRGMNLVVIDEWTQQVENTVAYDTYGSSQATSDMITYLNSLPYGKIVLVAIADSGELSLSTAGKDALKKLGASNAALDNLAVRDSWALIGKQGIGEGNGQQDFKLRSTGQVATITGKIGCGQPCQSTGAKPPIARVQSAGCDADPNGCGFVDFYFNGATITHQSARGMNFAVINQDTLVVEDTRSFDTYGDGLAGPAMASFLGGLAPGRIVLVAAADSAETHVDWNALKDLGASNAVASAFGHRESYALIGYKGAGTGMGNEVHVGRYNGIATAEGYVNCS